MATMPVRTTNRGHLAHCVHLRYIATLMSEHALMLSNSGRVSVWLRFVKRCV